MPQEENGDQSSQLMGTVSQKSVPDSDMTSEQAMSMGTAPQISAVVCEWAHEVVDPWDPDFEADYDADEEGPENKEPGLEALDENDENAALSRFMAYVRKLIKMSFVSTKVTNPMNYCE